MWALSQCTCQGLKQAVPHHIPGCQVAIVLSISPAGDRDDLTLVVGTVVRFSYALTGLYCTTPPCCKLQGLCSRYPTEAELQMPKASASTQLLHASALL